MATIDAFVLGKQFNATSARDAFALGSQFDDITVSSSIAITTPVAYETFQRSGTTASIAITGTYVGSPTSIEASFNGGSYATIVASPSGGTFSGTLSNQTQGQGTLTVRFTNDTAISATKSYVSIGDIFLVLGDSISQGQGQNNQTTSGSIVGTNIYEGGSWRALTDPCNAVGAGSHWPLLATAIMTAQSIPVAIINLGISGNDIMGDYNGWQSGQSVYNNAKTKFLAFGKTIKGVLVCFGPNAVKTSSTPSQATYNAAIDSWITAVQTDFQASVKVLWPIFGEMGTGSPPDRTAAENNIRAATIEAWGDNASCLPGPVLIDQNYSDDVHPYTDAQLQEYADRYYFCVAQAFYSGTTARGPRVSSIKENANRTSITVTFDSVLKTGSTFTTSAWKVYDNGTPVTVSGVYYAGTTSLVIVLAAALSGSGTISFGDGDTAVGATVPKGPARTLPSTSTINQPAEPFYASAASQYTSGGSGSRGRFVNAGA